MPESGGEIVATEQDIKRRLYELQRRGAINFHAAVFDLTQKFDMSKDEALQAVTRWINSWSQEDYNADTGH